MSLAMARVCPFWLLGSCALSQEECRHPVGLFGAVSRQEKQINIQRLLSDASKEIADERIAAAPVLLAIKCAFDNGRITAAEKGSLKASLRSNLDFEEEILVKLSRKEERQLMLDQLARKTAKIAGLEQELAAARPRPPEIDD
jgi:hypothetical protein